MKTINLEIKCSTDHYFYSVQHVGTIVTLSCNLFKTRVYEFPGDRIADDFVEEFLIEAVEAANDAGWRDRIEKRLEYLAGLLRSGHENSVGDTSQQQFEVR